MIESNYVPSFKAETEGEVRELERRYSNPELTDYLQSWREQERELDRLEMRTRYQWAKDLKAVYSSPWLYGSIAAETLLEQRMSELEPFQVFYHVAIFIDDEFFQQIEDYNATEVAKRRGHITWEHLKVFAWIGDTEEQQALLQQWMLEQWSVETLATKVTAAIRCIGDENQEEERRVISRITRNSQRLVADVKTLLVEGSVDNSQPVTAASEAKRRSKLSKAHDAVAKCLYQLGNAVTLFDSVALEATKETTTKAGADLDVSPKVPRTKKPATARRAVSDHDSINSTLDG